MTQEEKLLLIQDLSARLPYAVTVEHTNGLRGTLHNITVHHMYDDNDNVYDAICYTDWFCDEDCINIEHFKPYLFPMSSMTVEQVRNFYRIKGRNLTEEELIQFKSNHLSVVTNIATYNWNIDFLNKRHFDYRGLIEKGLAIDATGLNIY